MDALVDQLLERMTWPEKIGQLNLLPAGEGLTTGAGGGSALAERLDRGEVGAVFGIKRAATARAMQERALAGSRLRIPLFFAEDVIHGHRTVFPLPLGLACSWNMQLVQATAAHAAAEAAAIGIHQVYAPMIDIARDSRWGRIAESPGEDPWLAGRYAAAMVQGLQGADPARPGRVAACLKHLVAYGATQSGRDYDNASMALEELHAIHLPPFAAGVAAGAMSVMVAFNAVNKLPMHAHRPLIEGWLRGTAGFDGLVVSDYTGVRELVAHGLGDIRTCVARALHAGIDMDMVGEDFLGQLPALVEKGLDDPESGSRFDPHQIRAMVEKACRRVLVFKARLGLFKNAGRDIGHKETGAPSPAARRLARQAAVESAVLLENDGVLPLGPNVRVALIGPFGTDRANMLGTWAVSGDANDVASMAEVLQARGFAYDAARGCNIVDEPWMAARLNVFEPIATPDERSPEAMLVEARDRARDADVVLLTLGEAKEHAGESSSRLLCDIPPCQMRLLAAMAATGKPVVTIVFAGRPLVLSEVAAASSALLLAWHGGIEGPAAVIDLLFGAAEPTGRLAVTLPAHAGMTPVFHAAEPTGRPDPGHFEKFRTGWLDLPEDARGYPFGYGLGYAPVRYHPPELAGTRLSVEVENTGSRHVTETVQLYIGDPVARITRPVRELKAYEQVRLAAGERRRVVFEVDDSMLRYPLATSQGHAGEIEQVLDPGVFRLLVGPDSVRTQEVELVWPLTPKA